METKIVYNGVTYTKHIRQKYYYCSPSKVRYSRCLHRQMWYDNFGEIPKGYQLHHKNGNAFDNRIDNFELVERVEHIKMHMKKRVSDNPEWFKEFQLAGIKSAPEWHRSPEGIEWHRQHAKNCKFGQSIIGDKPCEMCGTSFGYRMNSVRFCSNKCKSAWRRENIPDITYLNCEKCGKLFTTRKYTPRRFCSSECKPTPNPLGHYARYKNNS